MKKALLLGSLFLTIAIALSGCGKTKPTSEPVISQPKTPVVKAVSLSDQIRKTQHFKMFPTLIAEKEANPNFDYADSCTRCHSEVTILKDPNAKLTDFFKGGKYATQRQGITCNVCHIFEGEKMINLRHSGWESCTVCHTNGGNPTLGKEVHHSQKEMVEGLGVGAVASKPSYKWAAMKTTFACTDCHVTNGQKHDFMIPGVTAKYDALGTTRLTTEINYEEFADMFKQDKCITCHYAPNDTITKIQQHQTEISKKLETLEPKFKDWEKKVEAMSKDDPRVQQFMNANTYFMYVTSDASKGAHNYALAKDLLERAAIEINKLK